MFKIGDFSKLTNVSVRMLHHYDKVGILKPFFIEEKSNYRYYDVTQIPTLQKVIMLRDLDFTIPEINALFHQWNEEKLRLQFDLKIKEKKEIIVKQQEQIEALEYAIKNISEHNTSLQHNIVIKKIPSQLVISLRRKVASYFHEKNLWESLTSLVDKYGIEVNNNDNISIYHISGNNSKLIDIEVCIPIKKRGNTFSLIQYNTLPAIEHMACMIVYGPYTNIAKAYQDFERWLKHHPHFVIDGNTRQVCHKYHLNESNIENYVTEIQIPIFKIK